MLGKTFLVEAFINGSWQAIAAGTTIGHKHNLQFPDIKTEEIRVTVKSCRRIAQIKTVGFYYAESVAGCCWSLICCGNNLCLLSLSGY